MTSLRGDDYFGKMLVLTFEDNEDDMMNRILSLINENANPPAMLGRIV